MAVAALIATVVLRNLQFNRSQRASAMQRPNLTEAEFREAALQSGGDGEVAIAVYRALAVYCSPGVRPNLDDNLERFFGIDPDELEGIVEDLFHTLVLPGPNRSLPEQIPSLASAADLVSYLSRRRLELADG